MKIQLVKLTLVLVLVSVICGGQGVINAVAGVNSVRAAVGDSFIADPASLSFSYNIGDPAPASKSVSLTSSGTALFFNVAPSTTTGGNWLSASATIPITPATLSVTVDPTGLGIGVYQGTVLLTPIPSGTPLSYAVTLNVSAAGTPAITMVGNALGYQAKLAPDTVFVVKGSNLGGANLVQDTPNYHTTLGGTSVTFTPAGGGAAIDGKMVYTLSFQIAGFLPSSVTPGVYAVRVTYNGLTSPPFNITVVPRSYGIATANSSGVGLAQATIGNINGGFSLTRFSAGSVPFGGFTWTLTPAHPGDTLVFWGTGGGADAANDTGGSSGDQTVAGSFRVIVGGREITPFYAGSSSGYPGLWQINFTLPADLALDCFATAQVRAGGELSNTVNVPIAAAGQTSCIPPGMSSAIISKIDSGADITSASFVISKLTDTSGGVDTTTEGASGAIFKYSSTQWILSYSGLTIGSCHVFDKIYAVGGVDPTTAGTTLDAGAKLPLTGPNLAVFELGKFNTANGPLYIGTPPAGTFTGGTYTLTGLGGTQVGAFTTSTVFPTNFIATNWAAITAVNRTQPLTFTWSGSAFDQVAINVSTTVQDINTVHIVSISCIAPGAPGTFTIPTAALGYLLPVPAADGSVSLQALSVPGTFTANLIGGGQTDIGSFQASVGVSKDIAVQ